MAALDRRRGGVIGICGEAGLGVAPGVHGTIGEGGMAGPHKVLFAAATALGRTIPYHALASALRDLFGIADRDDGTTLRRRASAVLDMVDPRLAADAATFGSMISLTAATPQWLAMDRGRRDWRRARHAAAGPGGFGQDTAGPGVEDVH
jgi:hypothetical protein